MGFDENKYSQEHLLGNALLPYVSNPKLRGRIRRSDPDGGHAYPWFSGLTGTRLKIEINFSNPLTPPPLTVTIDVDFTTDSYPDALTALRLISPSHLMSEDDNGFLALLSKHTGDVNYIKILPCGGGYTEAAGILGFDIDPLPGSISYAGELSSAPAFKDEANPQGTGLVALDEDVTSTVINRAIAAAQLRLERVLKDLHREMLVPVELAASVSTSGGVQYATLDAAATGSDLALQELAGSISASKLAVLLDGNRRRIFLAGGTQGGVGKQLKVRSICYGGPPFYEGDVFGAWPTPDGKSILDASVFDKVKHAAVAIDSIRGNILHCPGATFQTNLCHLGNTLVIEGATNDSPFGHNGEFIIDKVWGEEDVAVRPKSSSDGWAAGTHPTRLNLSKAAGKVYGNAKVLLSQAFPLVADLRFILDTTDAGATIPDGAGYYLHLLTTIQQDDFSSYRAQLALPLEGNLDDLATKFRRHADDLEDTGPLLSTYLHNASAVKTATTHSWLGGGDTIAASRVQTVIDTIIDHLSAAATRSGADRVGSRAMSGTPHSFTDGGSVFNQLTSLLGWFDAHVMGGADKHPAADLNYAGTATQWADGTAVGAQSVESMLDNIVAWLAAKPAPDGAGKVGAEATAGGLVHDLVQGSVRTQLTALLGWLNGHLGGITDRHTATVITSAARAGPPHAMGSSFVQTYLDNLLDWLNAHVAGTTDKHADTAITSVNRTNFNGSNVHDCLDDIDSKAAFKAAANYWTATQYFREINTQGYDITSFGGGISSAGGQINAENGNFRSTYNPGYSTGYTNQMVGKSMVKAWGQFWTPGSSGGSGGVISDGFNVSSCSAVNVHTFQINFASRMKVYASGLNHYGICAVMTPVLFGSPDVPWIPVIWDVDYQAGDWAYWIQVRFMAPTYPLGGDNNDGWWKCYGTPGHNIFFYLSIPGGRQV